MSKLPKEDLDWIRKIAPKNSRADLLMVLFTRKARKEESAIPLTSIQYNEEDMKDLVKKKRVKIVNRFRKERKIHLTGMGWLVAAGECSLRRHEK